MIELNRLYNECHLKTMARIPDNFVDMVLTSPPYDDLRDYEGYTFDFEKMSLELYRILKPGGICVWVVNDQCIDGSETLTSFKQAIYFVDVCGFKMHDTMIWEKPGFSSPSHNRYHQIFEYMFVLSKGAPKTVNRIKDRRNVYAGRKAFAKNAFREKDGSMSKRQDGLKRRIYDNLGYRTNIWQINSASHEQICKKLEHPAMFPQKLARDHIHSWSNPGDLVYDPMMGSGTVAVEAIDLGRNWIGSEVGENNCAIAEVRIQPMAKLKEQQIELFAEVVE